MQKKDGSFISKMNITKVDDRGNVHNRPQITGTDRSLMYSAMKHQSNIPYTEPEALYIGLILLTGQSANFS